MKVLIGNNFKALRTGSFVTADEESGEFLLDTENCDFAVATLKEIASGNKIKLSGKSKANFLVCIENGLTDQKLPEQNEMTDSQKVLDIVTAGVEAGKDDDTMLIEIVTSGIKFSAANKMFNKAMEEGGFRVALKKVKEAGRQLLLDSEFHPQTSEDVVQMSATICSKIEGADNNQAMRAIKAYCKEYELELPKAPKTPKGTFQERILAWIVSNPSAAKEDLADHLQGLGKTEERHMKKYGALLKFAVDYSKALSVDSETEAEAA